MKKNFYISKRDKEVKGWMFDADTQSIFDKVANETVEYIMDCCIKEINLDPACRKTECREVIVDGLDFRIFLEDFNEAFVTFDAVEVIRSGLIDAEDCERGQMIEIIENILREVKDITL